MNNVKATEPKIPTALSKALTAKPAAFAIWKGLTPIARRDFISWIESAKQEDTRKKRLERVVPMLLSGKRRPCCYAIVPMGLYRALADRPKSQTEWKKLTPDERRDFVAWVDAAKDSKVEHKVRIEKACAMLAAGKRKP